jgi:N12 class adenine-specific DNA methylase
LQMGPTLNDLKKTMSLRELSSDKFSVENSNSHQNSKKIKLFFVFSYIFKKFQKINNNFVVQNKELINTSYIQQFLAKNLDFLDHKC